MGSDVVMAQPKQERPVITFHFTDSLPKAGSKMMCPWMNYEPATTILTLATEIYMDSLVTLMKKHSKLLINLSYIQYDWPQGASESYAFDRVTAIRDFLLSKGIEKKRINRNAYTINSEEELEQINERYKKKAYLVELQIRSN